jgi:carbonic anhydrase/acetyltransferase-like protein (isoleucine patch superfamily)
MPHRRLANAAFSDVWRTIAMILAAVILGLVVLIVSNAIIRNNEAIEKSCILLNNVVVRSQAGQQSTSTRLLVGKILDQMTAPERERYLAYRTEEREKSSKNPLTIDCKKVADNPDGIKAIQVETP